MNNVQPCIIQIYLNAKIDSFALKNCILIPCVCMSSCLTHHAVHDSSPSRIVGKDNDNIAPPSDIDSKVISFYRIFLHSVKTNHVRNNE